MELNIQLLEEELFYGGAIEDGRFMPYGREHFERNLNVWMAGNQASSLLISNKGRYLYSVEPFEFQFEQGQLKVISEANIQLEEDASNLKEAYLKVVEKYFHPTKQIPDELMFTVPQYNTWIAMEWDPSQDKVLKYAHEIIEHGFLPGVLMIDDGWSVDYGVWMWDTKKFPNPKKMMEELHSLGFKVMLWEVPFISPDSKTFRELEEKGYLVKTKEGLSAISHWWNGYSGVLDLTNPDAVYWIKEQNQFLMDEYGVDGFKLDAADPEYYYDNFVFKENISRVHQARIWSEIGASYAFNEMRACFRNEGAPLAQRMRDKNHSWDVEGLNEVIPNAISMGLEGFSYFAPDMIGGGMVPDFHRQDFVFDEELFVRYTQVAVFLPMMQFSMAPWRVLSDENLAIIKDCITLRDQYKEKLMELVIHSSNTCEPICRPMEYHYPNVGYADLKTQFMFGDDMIIAPVVEKQSYEKKVFIPKGIWEDELGNSYKEGEYVIQVPLNRLLYFKRKTA